MTYQEMLNVFFNELRLNEKPTLHQNFLMKTHLSVSCHFLLCLTLQNLKGKTAICLTTISLWFKTFPGVIIQIMIPQEIIIPEIFFWYWFPLFLATKGKSFTHDNLFRSHAFSIDYVACTFFFFRWQWQRMWIESCKGASVIQGKHSCSLGEEEAIPAFSGKLH